MRFGYPGRLRLVHHRLQHDVLGREHLALSTFEPSDLAADAERLQYLPRRGQ
jgi:hypothetical protein